MAYLQVTYGMHWPDSGAASSAPTPQRRLESGAGSIFPPPEKNDQRDLA